LCAGPDFGALHETVLPKAVVHEPDNPGRDSEAKPFTAAASGQDEGIQTNDVPIKVDRGPPLFPALIAASAA